MNIALSTTLTDTDFATAVDSVKTAISDQGFGVLTEIDMQATLKAKLDEDMERYVILGACNPGLAHRAVGVMKQIGLLLPCNVVVRADPAANRVAPSERTVTSAITRSNGSIAFRAAEHSTSAAQSWTPPIQPRTGSR